MPDLHNLISIQLYVAIFLAIGAALLHYRVSMILSIRSKKKVARVDAWRMVAFVAKPFPRRDFSKMNQPTSMRSADVFTRPGPAADYSVAVLVSAAAPFPATVSFSNIFPKSFRERRALAFHTAELLRPMLLGLPEREKHAIAA